MQTPVQSEVTAPVLEFRCLYTFNITQKKKKWQDGTLKFHTRNKRVMVYDESYNYIGDTHLQTDSEIQEGNELDLQCGALIQVADLLRTTQSDITTLVQKKPKYGLDEVKGKEISLNGSASQGSVLRDGITKKHKSLRSILASQASPPSRLDSERAHNALEDIENIPPPKRTKISSPTNSPMWSITATLKRPTSKVKVAPKRLSQAVNPLQKPITKAPNSLSTKISNISASQSTLKIKQVIDLTSDSPTSSSSPLHLGPAESLPIASQSNVASIATAIEPTVQRVELSLSPSITSVASDLNMGTPIIEQRMNYELIERSDRIGRLNMANTRAKPLKLSKDKSRGKLICMHMQVARGSAQPKSIGDNNLSQLHPNNQLVRISNDQNTVFQPRTPREEISQGCDEYKHCKGKRSSLRSKGSLARESYAALEGQIIPKATLRDSGEPSKSQRAYKMADYENALPQPELELPSNTVSNSLTAHHSLNRNNLCTIINRPTSSLLTPNISLIPDQRSIAGSMQHIQSGVIQNGGLECSPAIANNLVATNQRQQQGSSNKLNRAKATTTLMRRTFSTGLDRGAFAHQDRPVLQNELHTKHIPGRAAAAAAPLASPPMTKPVDVGPWSSEALDLFDWRPPDWEARRAKVPASAAMVD
jgi:hypothetical protein